MPVLGAGGDLPEEGHVWTRPTVLWQLVGPLPQASLFSPFVAGIAREGEEFGKLRTVPDSRSGPSVSSNPSYPSITGVGGDYKFPWIPTLVSACCIVSSTGNACLPAELRQAQAPKQKDRTSTDTLSRECSDQELLECSPHQVVFLNATRTFCKFLQVPKYGMK